jgi:hypothetical protein
MSEKKGHGDQRIAANHYSANLERQKDTLRRDAQDKAEKYTAAAATHVRSAEMHHTLAQTHERSGDRAQAATHWTQSASNHEAAAAEHEKAAKTLDNHNPGMAALSRHAAANHNLKANDAKSAAKSGSNPFQRQHEDMKAAMAKVNPVGASNAQISQAHAERNANAKAHNALPGTRNRDAFQEGHGGVPKGSRAALEARATREADAHEAKANDFHKQGQSYAQAGNHEAAEKAHGMAAHHFMNASMKTPDHMEKFRLDASTKESQQLQSKAKADSGGMFKKPEEPYKTPGQDLKDRKTAVTLGNKKDAAFKLTDKAEKSGTAEDHKAAAEAHHEVASAYGKAANAQAQNRTARELNSESANHKIIANSHDEKAARYGAKTKEERVKVEADIHAKDAAKHDAAPHPDPKAQRAMSAKEATDKAHAASAAAKASVPGSTPASQERHAALQKAAGVAHDAASKANRAAGKYKEAGGHARQAEGHHEEAKGAGGPKGSGDDKGGGGGDDRNRDDAGRFA